MTQTAKVTAVAGETNVGRAMIAGGLRPQDFEARQRLARLIAEGAELAASERALRYPALFGFSNDTARDTSRQNIDRVQSMLRMEKMAQDLARRRLERHVELATAWWKRGQKIHARKVAIEKEARRLAREYGLSLDRQENRRRLTAEAGRAVAAREAERRREEKRQNRTKDAKNARRTLRGTRPDAAKRKATQRELKRAERGHRVSRLRPQVLTAIEHGALGEGARMARTAVRTVLEQEAEARDKRGVLTPRQVLNAQLTHALKTRRTKGVLTGMAEAEQIRSIDRGLEALATCGAHHVLIALKRVQRLFNEKQALEAQTIVTGRSYEVRVKGAPFGTVTGEVLKVKKSSVVIRLKAEDRAYLPDLESGEMTVPVHSVIQRREFVRGGLRPQVRTAHRAANA